ncbi:MAG TPA: glycoside hydrolase family 16 protein [Patescibacteria group bacterium]|nr:glycoside hydrolase family 16 protein [Patescibacteria group bacterium]
MGIRRHAVAILAGIVIGSVVLVAPVAAARPGGGAGPKLLRFDGYDWLVKSSARRIGPGPNLFDPNGAFLDGSGNLHLRIARVNGKWQSSEVINQRTLGLGTYSWTIQGDLAGLDKNAVLGLFTWNDDPADNHREIDVEFARWSNETDPTNGQFVVQPSSTTGNLLRITQPTGITSSTHAFAWKTSSVDFTSSAAPGTWTYDGPDVPRPGGENARMNLWLFRGQAPSNGQSIEIVITDFTFTPLP